MNKLVLVGLDSSEMAPAVLASALEIARALDAKLVLLHAVGIPPALPPEALVASPDDVVGLLTRAAERDLAERARSVPPERLQATVVEVGVAWRTICEEAVTRDVAMIVVGAHGHRWSDRILGTTATRVVSHADRSVLVVRAR